MSRKVISVDRASVSSVDGFVAEILEVVGRSAHWGRVASARLHHDFEAIARRDYERDLDAHFSKREMQALFMALEWTLPGLNREQFRPKPLQELTLLASKLGANFKGTTFAGREGSKLHGFYAKDGRGRPLICVNTAHHTAAVAAAFWHEMGHHLTARILDTRWEPVELSFGAEYDQHLEKPMEVVADMLVCLAAYPKPVARRLFASALQSESPGRKSLLTDEALSKSRAHLRMLTGLDFADEIPTDDKLDYLAGMIHFVKLRLALLARYGL